MKIYIVAPHNLLRPAHVEVALKQAKVEVSELLLPERERGTLDLWLRDWAAKNDISVRDFQGEDAQALKLLERSQEAAVVAVISPDHPDTLEIVAEAESKRIPVYIYRELYRQDPRVNCRFSPVERPDVWLKALTAEQRDFFRRLHALCDQYNVELTSTSGTSGSLMRFADGTEFEGVELDENGCKVRPRGSFRYRRIPLS